MDGQSHFSQTQQNNNNEKFDTIQNPNSQGNPKQPINNQVLNDKLGKSTHHVAHQPK